MLYQLAIFMLLLMNVLDVAYTQDIMLRGIEESNPFALWLIENYGFKGLLMFKTLSVGVLFVFSRYVEDCSKKVRVFFWLGITNYIILTMYHLIFKIIAV